MDSLFIKDEILIKPTSIISKKEGEIDVELKEVDERRSSPDIYLNNLRSRNTCDWVNFGLWHSGPSNLSSDHIVSATTNQVCSH